MLPAEDLFVHCYVLVDDLIKTGLVVIPARPGPVPACTDAEILTIGLVRHLLGRRSESGFLAEIGREWPRLFRIASPERGQPSRPLALRGLRADPPGRARRRPGR